MQKLNTVDMISLVLVIIGGLNWGLKGLADFDIVSVIFQPMSMLSRLVYVLIGLSAVYLAVNVTKFERK